VVLVGVGASCKATELSGRSKAGDAAHGPPNTPVEIWKTKIHSSVV
jgi:hypothetical protein